MFPDAKKVKELTDGGYSDTRQMVSASNMSWGDNFPWDRREGEQGVIPVERAGDSSAVCSWCYQRSQIIASIYSLACVL